MPTRRSHVAVAVMAAVLAGCCLLAARPGEAPALAEAGLFDDGLVRQFDLTFGVANWERMLASLPDGALARADLVADGRLYSDVGVAYKGNSSSRIPARKKPFNLTLDAYVPGQRMMGYDTLNLNNGFLDPTLVREPLTYLALRPYLPTPKATYARLSVAGEYFGLYILAQQIERTYLDEWFGADDQGFLFKGDRPDAPAQQAQQAAAKAAIPASPAQGGEPGPDLRWLGEDLAAYRQAYDLKTDRSPDAAYTHLRELVRVLDAPASEGGVVGAGFPAAIESVLDVDGALWYIAAHNLFANFDSYYNGHNYYLYRSSADERFHILSWDTNESFGVFRAPGVDPSDSRTVIEADPFLMAGAANRPLLHRLLAVPAYRDDYLAHYRTLLGEAFATPQLQAQAERYRQLVRPDVVADPNLLYGVQAFDLNLWSDVRVGPGGASAGGSRTRGVPGVLGTASARARWLAARPDLSGSDHSLAGHERRPESPEAGQPATVEIGFAGGDLVSAVSLLYRVDGSAPSLIEMRPDRSGAAWSASIPGAPAGSVVTYYARARLGDGRSAFHPSANQTHPWTYSVGSALPRSDDSDLVLNELQADNRSTLSDQAGEYDDWIEIHNRGPRSMPLGGLYVSDDPDQPHKHPLPDIQLAPGGYYLVWCDTDPSQGPDHADFGLSRDGEWAVLASTTAILDMVEFGPQDPDKSYGRVTDGASDWAVCATPSPRQANSCRPAGSATHAPGEAVSVFLPLTLGR